MAASVALLMSFSLGGCSDDIPAADGGPTSDAGPDAAEPPATLPTLASMAPCPAGWLEETDGYGVTTCMPWRSGAAMDCGPDEAHFTGEAGCVRVGTECPSGDFPTDLPSGGVVLYVLSGATAGDGSMARPFGTISLAMARAAAGTTIAVGKGHYSDEVAVRSGVHVIGACVRETVVSSAIPLFGGGVFTAAGTGSLVRNLRIEDSPRPGVFVGAGNQLRIEDVVIDGVEFVGLVQFDLGGTLEVESVVVRNTRSKASDGKAGTALAVLGGHIDARRIALEHNRDIGVIVDGPTTTLTLVDAIVRGVAPQDRDMIRGRGIEVTTEATATLERVVIEDTHEVAVWMEGGATVAAEHLIVRGTLPRVNDDYGGFAIVADGAASFTAAKTLLDGNITSGAIIVGTSIALEDFIIRGTQAAVDGGRSGRGLELQPGVTGTVGPLALIGNRDVGLFAGGASTDVEVRDLIVADTLSRVADQQGGRGVEVVFGGLVSITRARFEGNREVAATAIGTGARLRLTDVSVGGTLPQDCAPDTCEEAGSGIGAYNGGYVEATRFLVVASNICGVHVARGGDLDIHDGEVRDNPIGACIQVDGYDVNRLSDGVLYQNDSNLQATSLPVPEPSESGIVR